MRGMLPVTATLPSAPVDIGGQLEAALKTFWRHWKACFLLALIPQLLALLPLLPVLGFEGGGDPLAALEQAFSWYTRPLGWLLFLFAMLGQLFLYLALCFRLGYRARGQDPGLARSANVALSRFAAGLGSVALFFVLLMLALLPALVLLGLAFSGTLGTLWSTLAGLLGLLLIGPGAWWMVAAGLGLYCCILERTGPVASLLRSLRLIRGHWWEASAVLGVVLAAHLVVHIGASTLGGLLIGASTLGSDQLDIMAPMRIMLALQLLMSPLAAWLQIWLSCGVLVIFNNRVLAEASGAAPA